jgi:TolB protein
VLTSWSPKPKSTNPTYLVLTNQLGQRYIVLKETGALTHSLLYDWSGNGQSALFVSQTGAGKPTMFVVDLRTGLITNTFDVPTSNTNNFQTAGFTRPNGFGALVETYTTHAVLTRYSLSGVPAVTYPYAFSSVGKINGSWLYKPDGTELILGAKSGLAIVANDGTVRSQLRLPDSSFCMPQSWWTATVVLASCQVGTHSGQRLFEFNVAGGAPRALTRNNVPPDSGDLSGWRVDGHVYVNVASACGYVYLAKLVGAAPIMVKVPGVPTGHTVNVVGASNTSLALMASIACQGGPSLLWYTPSSNTVRVVLGPRSIGGQVGESVAYPRGVG